MEATLAIRSADASQVPLADVAASRVAGRSIGDALVPSRACVVDPTYLQESTRIALSDFPRCHCGRAAEHLEPPLCYEHLSERPLPPEFADVYEPERVIVYSPSVEIDDPAMRREQELIHCRDFVAWHRGKHRGMRLQSVGEGDAAFWCVSAYKFGGDWGSKDDGE